MAHTVVRERIRVKPFASWLQADWLLLGAIVGVGFALRAWAIGWGLPYVDHPDEPALVNVALRMLRDGDLNPHFFLYPSLYFYLLLGVFGLHYRWGVSTGLYQSLATMPVTTDLYTTIPGFFVWGRALGIMIGSVTALTMFGVGKRAWSRSAGLCAALVVATSPFHMRHSQYVTTDVTSAWLTLLSFGGAIAIWRNGRWRAYLLAGVFAGLAASTKYNAAVIVLPIAVAHAIHWRRSMVREIGRLTAAAAASIAGFVIGTPYALLAWPEWRDGFLFQIGHYGDGAHGDIIGAWNVAGYAEFFWNHGLRSSICLALLAGLAVLLRRRPALAALWLSFALPFLLLHLAQTGHFMRNLLPLIVLCALPVGIAAAAAISWLAQRMPRSQPLPIAAALLALYWVPAEAAWGLTTFVGKTDSKVLAGNYMRTLPRGGRIAVELNPVAVAADPIVEPVPFLTEHTIDWYRANGYRYLLANEYFRDAQDRDRFAAMLADAVVLEAFPGDSAGQPGPRIEVLDLDPKPDQLAIVDAGARFGSDLRLLGYELQPGPLRPAISPLDGAAWNIMPPPEGLQINLYWQTQHALPEDYMLFVHLLNAAGDKVGQRDALLRQDEYPSSRWQPDEIVIERADVPLPPLPPGFYTVRIGVYSPQTGERLMLSQTGRSPDGSSLDLHTFEVR
jgi:4-amino-4-deoxy-L-arabinose transferase-like glycosyltransferase